MSKSIVFLFSGQGSQYYHMGKELFNQQPIFRDWMLQLDNHVRKIIGESVLDRLYDPEKRQGESFNRLRYTHPAIFMVEYALAQVLLAGGIRPDYVLGTSMGEFVAAVVAGVTGIEETLECLLKQAELIEQHCEKGGMTAILADSRLYHETPLMRENCELVAVNYDQHFVVAGNGDGIRKIEAFLKSKELIFQGLPVTYGFHSSSIDTAAAAYKDFLKTQSFQRPKIPMVSCLYGRVVSEIPPDYFWEIARRPIRFQEAVRGLERLGEHQYADLGPSGTLANFIKHSVSPEAGFRSNFVITPFNRDMALLEKMIQGLRIP